MAALTNWQKSLRRSTGEINKPIIKKTHHVRSKRLPSIVEDENVFADENAVATKPGPRGDRQRRRLSTKGSVSEVDQAVEESANPRFRKTSSGKSPTKVDKSLSFLRPFPKRETFLLEDEVYKNLPSPIPLPPGVTSKCNYLFLITFERNAPFPFCKTLTTMMIAQSSTPWIFFATSKTEMNGSSPTLRKL